MWNNFDFWVVVLSILGGSGLVPGLGNQVQLFRLLRLLRVLKLLKMVVELQMILQVSCRPKLSIEAHATRGTEL